MSGAGWSLSEIRSLAVTAARGAGYPAGLAQEVGFAVEYLQARCAPGIMALAALLDAGRPGAEACPITLGAALSDGALVLADLERSISQPLLLVPFVATALPEAGHTMMFEETVIVFSGAGITCEGDPVCPLATVRFQPCEPTVGECSSRVPEAMRRAVKRLTIHASRTYAPETEASRSSGAGAGLTDND